MFLLEIRNLTKHFGGLAAVNNLNFHVNQGEILGLIGPNGAGKSTFFNLVTSYYKPSSGKIIFKGKDITNFKTHQVAELGIGRTFQKTSVFKEMSVKQNINVAHNLYCNTSLYQQFLSTYQSREIERKISKKTNDIINFIGLKKYENEIAKNLPHGVLRLLEIAIVLAIKPILILLDEPFTGMNTAEVNKVVNLVKLINKEKITIIIVEHNMQAILKISDRMIVMDFGNKIAEGKPDEIIKDEKVIKAYIGE